ncbi:MAG: hypothetical protein HUN04_25355 [Desulfobacter sp.]|nr:MAG: hypothetical protein HUN04_25355 [Desulfobacter sp.]
MEQTIEYAGLESEITKTYQAHGEGSRMHIEALLGDRLAALAPEDRLETLDRLIQGFESPARNQAVDTAAAIPIDDHVLARVIKLLLGKDIAEAGFDSQALLESLAQSINTVFESLNQLIGVINTTLVGKQDADQTIRQVIGYHLEGSERARPLETYIGQIGKAFFESQEASKKAAHAKVKQILEELAPAKIEKETDVSKLSPMRKSRYYEVYETKYEKFENWFESGRFMESFLREFEKNCRKISI